MLQSLHLEPRRYPSFLAIDNSPNQTDAGVSGLNAKVKNRGQKSSIREKKRKKPLDLFDIPNEVIQNIYRFHAANGERDLHRARLVNKRLAVIGLPFALCTISVSSQDALSALLSDPESPLYRPNLSQHVRCLEIAFVPQSYLEVETGNQSVHFFPRLENLRFKFSLGVLAYGRDALQASLSEDSLFRAVRWAPNNSFQLFLSRLGPKTFEWISPELNRLYILRVCPMLRSLFLSWSSLSSIHWDGICLVEQPNLTTWTFALLAERVHIRGPLSDADLVILDGLQNMGDSPICRLLTLEESFRKQDANSISLPNEVPVLTYGNTLVTLINWTPTKRRALKSSFNRPSTFQSGTTASHSTPPLIVDRSLELSILRFLTGSIVWMTLFPLLLVLFVHQQQYYWHECLDGRWENPYRDLFSLTRYPNRSLMLHPV